MTDELSKSTLNLVRSMKKALVRDSILALAAGAVLFWVAVKIDALNVIHRIGYKYQFYQTDKIINFLLTAFLIYSVFSLVRFFEMVRFFRVMLKISRYDYLTRIYNRRSLIELLEMEFLRNRRSSEGHFSFILFDIDDFKNINDIYGHGQGDTVLKGVGKTLASSVRKSDITGRFGGDEFAVILPYTTLDNAVTVAEKIKEKITSLRFSKNSKESIGITLSMGVIEVDSESKIDTFEKVIAEADKFLYCAKKRGKNTICSCPTATISQCETCCSSA
ncbi:diguanylate cyclase [Denitrovibrio acetiphilus DSM 12809]|uniref:diguanylate cyclase n=1 Tax=Denitrovibrio acetiphilus (strain DSM 12809 / NBRC 114555 / N2460) TaxID=522772 RepID=D4H5X6_DENA2|nr:GGDEF domain-containing protein [Denitrovibrio acetiphilus]ADD69567.1 diguanylate cyclase [Denitrovibrio acetiphilus DSM 12809]